MAKFVVHNFLFASFFASFANFFVSFAYEAYKTGSFILMLNLCVVVTFGTSNVDYTSSRMHFIEIS